MKLDNDGVKGLLPHRGTMLLIDEVVEGEAGAWLVCTRLVGDHEHWVDGHFPQQPIFPGVLVVEALAQAAGLTYLTGHPDDVGRLMYLVKLENFKFRRMVQLGESLKLRAEVKGCRRGFWTFMVEATVDGARVASGQLTATLGNS